MDENAPTSATITPRSAQYDVGKLRRWVFGEHYRTLGLPYRQHPILDLDTTYGGLTPLPEEEAGKPAC
ncbi:MAG: hypothetical protein R2788_18070 [Saprospiraceae bacterium]